MIADSIDYDILVHHSQQVYHPVVLQPIPAILKYSKLIIYKNNDIHTNAQDIKWYVYFMVLKYTMKMKYCDIGCSY